VNVYRGKKSSVPVVAVESIKLPLSKEEKAKLKTELTLDELINAPVYKGVEVGKIEFFVDGKLIGRSAVKTADVVPEKKYGDYFRDVLDIWFKLARLK